MSSFIYRGPLPPHSPLFCGRQTELQKLQRICLGHEQTYATIYGGRQTGKTSLLMRLEHDLPEHICACRVDFHLAPSATSEGALTFIVHTLAENIPAAPTPATSYNPLTFRRYVQDVVKRLGTGQRLLLMLEELGALPAPARRDLANILRGIFTNRHSPAYRPLDQLVVVLAGSIELYELAVIEVSPLQNICEQLYLGDLGSEAVRLMVAGFTDQGVSPAKATDFAHAIHTQVKGHPYLTQRLAAEVVARHRAGAAIEVPTLAAQLPAADAFFQYLHKALVEHNLLAETKPLLEGHLRFGRADEPMARLELLGVAVEREGYWAVRNPLIAQALGQWLGVQAASGVPAAQGLATAPLVAVTKPLDTGSIRRQHLEGHIQRTLEIIEEHTDQHQRATDPLEKAHHTDKLKEQHELLRAYQAEHATLAEQSSEADATQIKTAPQATPHTHLETALVRVFKTETEGTVAVGMGVWLDDTQVLTCAHVVSQALNHNEAIGTPPVGALWLDCPLVAPGVMLQARVTAWYPVRSEQAGDFAILTVTQPRPAEAASAPLVSTPALWGHHWRAFGFPEDYPSGVWSTGVVRGTAVGGLVQLDADPEASYAARPGFSGGPVWDEQAQGVVGLLARTDLKARAAQMLPVSALLALQPALPLSRAQHFAPAGARHTQAYAELQAQWQSLTERHQAVLNDLDVETDGERRRALHLRAGRIVVEREAIEVKLRAFEDELADDGQPEVGG